MRSVARSIHTNDGHTDSTNLGAHPLQPFPPDPQEIPMCSHKTVPSPLKCRNDKTQKQMIKQTEANSAVRL
jgi:hypothetical protein